MAEAQWFRRRQGYAGQVGELSYAVGHGAAFAELRRAKPSLAPGEPAAERESFGEVVLVERLRAALRRLNGAIPEEAREEALRKVLWVGTPALTQTNRAFHRMLRDGVPVEYPRPDGSIAGDHVRLVDFDEVRANDWLGVNQFTVIDGQHNTVTQSAGAIDLLPTLTSLAPGKITLPAGRSPLILHALDIPGKCVMDARRITLTLLD